MSYKLLERSVLGLLVAVTLHTSTVLYAQLNESLSYIPVQARADSSIADSPVLDGNANHAQYLDAWQVTHGVLFTTSSDATSNRKYNWQVVNDQVHDQHIAYYRSFDKELSRYNSNFLQKVGLKKVVFVDNISIDGQALLGFADILSGTLYFNIEASRADTGLIKSTIHHEIAHLLFYELYGSDMFTLAEWPSESGYVSEYAKTSLAEDMAEVFAHMHTEEYQAALIDSMKQDQVLLEKVQIVTAATQAIDPAFALQ